MGQAFGCNADAGVTHLEHGLIGPDMEAFVGGGIAAEAGLTRGALYHQFTDKTELFAAVVEQVEQDVMATIMRRLGAEGPADPDPLDELVGLLGTSAWYAPGAAAAQMVDSICLDEKRILPATAYLEGEYGISDLYMGVPVRLGKGGAEEVVKLKLSAAEKKMLDESVSHVRELVDASEKYLNA